MKNYEIMEELLTDLKTGIVSPIDLDEQTELRFIAFMKDHIRNNMEEIKNTEEKRGSDPDHPHGRGQLSVSGHHRRADLLGRGVFEVRWAKTVSL